MQTLNNPTIVGLFNVCIMDRGNAACILGTVHPSKKLDELFYV